jgi:hypothetical protein
MAGLMRSNDKRAALYVVILTMFFGYLGYNEFFVDDTAVAQRAIQANIASLPASQTKETSSDYYGLKRAQIALNEYKGHAVEATRSCNCGPGIDKYTQGTPAPWSADFVSWVSNEAGSPIVNDRTGSWRISNTRLFTESLKQYGTFYTREKMMKNNLQPKIGDFVVFWRGNPEDNLGYIDIIVELKNERGKAGLVGGNLKDRVVYREDFPYLEYAGFRGFGRPEKN